MDRPVALGRSGVMGILDLDMALPSVVLAVVG